MIATSDGSDNWAEGLHRGNRKTSSLSQRARNYNIWNVEVAVGINRNYLSCYLGLRGARTLDEKVQVMYVKYHGS
jgi:hypothetical protein